MTRSMGFYGATTNNLKNVDLEIPRDAIVGLAGISGGGKSSLAFSTVYAVCDSEFRAIAGDAGDSENYRIERFKNICPAISIRQQSKNINPRSTIFSYFKFQNLMLQELQNKEDVALLRLNSYENLCESCRGARANYELDEEKIIDSSRTISQFPFRIYSGANKEKEAAKLIKYCELLGIQPDVRLMDLSAKIREKIIYGMSEEKVNFRFKFRSAYRSRTEFYEGPIPRLNRYANSDKKSERVLAITYSSSGVCKKCKGSGIRKENYNNALLKNEISLFHFLTEEIEVLRPKVKNERIKRFFDYICRLGIGHLALIRSIPSLSGGELQKMRLAKAASTPITGLLYVLDEISANVYPPDYKILAQVVHEIRDRGNSVLLVDHVSEILRTADILYSVGPAAGSQGGSLKLIQTKDLPDVKSKRLQTHILSGETFVSPVVTKNNINKLSLPFEVNSFCCVVGPAGSGKSTFFRQWAKQSDEVLYVTQELPQSNYRSTFSTYLGLGERITKIFASAVGQPDALFKYVTSNPNLCHNCGGAGDVVIGDIYFGQHRVVCQECDGNRIVGIESYTLHGINFHQLMSLPVKDLQDFSELKTLRGVVSKLETLGLEHLSLNRRTESLSGGELKRLKLARYLQKRINNKVLVLDEPCAGLDTESCKRLLSYLSKLSRDIKALLIVEHRQEAYEFVDYIHLFGPGAGRNGGRLVGTKVPI